MANEVTTHPGDHVPTADKRAILYNVSFRQFEAQLELRGERALPRMAYVDGTLELMTPSKDHERIKSYVGRLVEAYALETGIDLSPYGSWLLKSAPKEAGLEPDECYLFEDQDKDAPDLAIEVVWTSGGIPKLEIYRRFGVPQVWIWKKSRIEVFSLGDDGYEPREKSTWFPELDLELLCTLFEYPTALQAVKALQAKLRQ